MPGRDVTREAERSAAEVSLCELRVHPIKSCGGFEVLEWPVDERGLVHDRRWMLVDEDDSFMTQRRWPRMALITTRITDEALVVAAPGMSELELPLRPTARVRGLAGIFGDTVEVIDAGADGWFEEFLGTRCRLVHLPDDSVRLAQQGYARPWDRVGLADAFSFLLISAASLEDLNARLDAPVPMDRFRPNLVVEGCEPLAEDRWRRIRVGPLPFRVVKPCARCSIPMVDQETGVRGKEPMRTLATYRRGPKGSVLFGQNLAHDGHGVLRVGDEVTVLA